MALRNTSTQHFYSVIVRFNIINKPNLINRKSTHISAKSVEEVKVDRAEYRYTCEQKTALDPKVISSESRLRRGSLQIDSVFCLAIETSSIKNIHFQICRRN